MCNTSFVKISNSSTMDEVHKEIKFAWWGSDIMRFIFRSHLNFIKIAQKYMFYEHFEGFGWLSYINLKIDLIMSES